MKVLFWNTAGNAIGRYVCRVLDEHNVDVAVVAEFDRLDIDSIEAATAGAYRPVFIGGCDKVRFIVRQDICAIVYSERTRYSILKVSARGFDIVVAGLHMQDMRNRDSTARTHLGGEIMADVEDVSFRSGCENIVLIGDFNANPYSVEMLAPYSFNAVLFKDVIRESGFCTFEDRQYRRLYNPVLHFISEDSKTYGSYYLSNTREPGPIWHCLDQALFSDSLVDRIMDFKYLREIEGESIIARTKPKAGISDHLPLLVEISEGKASL